MKATWILAAALAVAPLASAQAQPMSQQPELKPPAVSEAPPLPQLPPGVLDGLAPPTQAPQSRPQGGPKSAAGGLESVVVRNATPGAAWISVYDAGLPTGGACVQPKGDMILAVPPGARLRAESTDGTCQQRTSSCDTAIELAPGTKGLELRSAGNGCALQAANGGLLQRRPISNRLKVVNTSPNLWLWVSRYDSGREPFTGIPRKNIVETTCLRPGSSVDYTIYRNTYYNGGARKFESGIRGEFVQGNCRHPRPCDTQLVNMEWWGDPDGKTWYIHYDPQGRIPTRFPPPFMNRGCGGTWSPNG